MNAVSRRENLQAQSQVPKAGPEDAWVWGHGLVTAPERLGDLKIPYGELRLSKSHFPLLDSHLVRQV